MIVADLRYSWSLQRRVHQGRGHRGHDCSCAGWRLQAHLLQPHARRLRCKVELQPGTRALPVVGVRADEALPQFRDCADPATDDPHHGRPQLLCARNHIDLTVQMQSLPMSNIDCVECLCFI
jgi:hypothetical protein